MSAKDERAREILRGFKLYPPGSGAGPGGLGRRPLAVETGWGRGPRQVGTRREAAGGRKERRPGPPTGPGAGGGARGVLREEGDVAWSLGGVGGGAPELGWEKCWTSATGVGEASLGPSSGPHLEAEKGLRPSGKGRGGAVGWARSPANPLAGSPRREQGKVTWSE